MKNNPIFQVLVATSPTLLVAGGKPETLAVGQLGIFNADTNLSVTAALPDRFYLAVGIGDELGNLVDIRRSAQQEIKKGFINRIDSAKAVAPSDQVIELDFTNFSPQFDTNHTIRFNLLSGQTMNLSGFKLPIKSFTIYTPCAGGDCVGDYDLADFCDLVVAEINNDDEQLLTATTDGSSVTVTVHSVPKSPSIHGINPLYSFLRQFTVTVSLSNGFEGGGHVITNTPAVFAKGSGYDLAKDEYFAGGWSGKPGIYRISELNDLFGSDIQFLTDPKKNYWIMTINHSFPSNSGGMLNYINEAQTLVAIESIAGNNAFTTALNGLFSALVSAQASTLGSFETIS